MIDLKTWVDVYSLCFSFLLIAQRYLGMVKFGLKVLVSPTHHQYSLANLSLDCTNSHNQYHLRVPDTKQVAGRKGQTSEPGDRGLILHFRIS